jgi:hypothetical protein
MTPEQISQLAREAGFAMRGVPASYWNCLPSELEAFANLVRNTTLEEAALACKAYGEIPRMDSRVPNALAYQIKSMKS